MKHGCAAFWKHTNIRPGDRVFPCCRFNHSVGEFDGDLDAVLNLPAYHHLREQSRRDEPINGCQKCYQEESVGIPSLRQKINSEYDTHDVELQWLEIGFDNVCNLACDGCGPEFSSTWAAKLDVNTIKPVVVHKNIQHVPETINKVLFLGGEPLMTNQHEKFLRLVPRPSQVKVIYNTNGSFLLSDPLTDLLKTFKQVSFVVSVDGHGALNEQVRSGSDWQQISTFIDQIQSLDFDMSIHTVLHRNNWHGLADLATWIQQNNFTWTINCLSYPAHLDINTLVGPDRERLLDMLHNNSIPNNRHIRQRLQQKDRT